jgi:hypothetical protein
MRATLLAIDGGQESTKNKHRRTFDWLKMLKQ